MICRNVINEGKEPTENYHEFKDYLKRNFTYGIILNGKLYDSLTDDIINDYKTLTPTKFERGRSGLDLDFTAYALRWFKNNTNLPAVAYCIMSIDKVKSDHTDVRLHTWVSFKDKLQESDNRPYKSFEVSWEWENGIWEFSSETEMINTYFLCILIRYLCTFSE